MSWVNYDEVITTLRLEGFDLDTVEVGRMKRVKRPGHSQKGWYVLHEITIEGTNDQALIGSYGYWSGAESITGKISAGKGRKLTDDQKKAIEARAKADRARALAERKQAAEKAASAAARVWRAYIETGESDYLKRKAVDVFGLRFSPAGNGTFAVPMADTSGRIWGLQIIRGKDRGKKLEKEFFPAGLEMKGKFHTIGVVRDVLLVAEGYATAATLHQATGLPVAVAFTAGNLLPVCEALRKQYKRIHILVCADDDYLTEGNPGCAKAESAALAVGGAWVKPEFPSDRAGKKLTDFNDLAHFPDGGEAQVRFQIEKAIAAQGWSVWGGVTAAREPDNEGGGGRRAAVSVMALDDAVARFVPLDDGTGKYLFDTWTNKIAHRDQMIALLPAGVRGDDVKRHPDWISRGAFYLDQVGFDPAGNDHNVKLNTWKGWPMQPKAGRCDHMLETLEYLCSGEGREKGREVFQWLLRWMAYPLQHPGAKMNSAVIMHGPQGTGKSAIFQAYARIYGDYSTILNQRGLEDKFNADWADSKLFILAEEVVTRAEMWHIKNELKELVTGEWIRVNPKNVAAYRQRNQVNIVYLSNENQPLPIENDDRRHLVVWTPPHLEEAFYDNLFKEQENGGIEAFYDYLMQLDLGDFHHKKRPPMTEAKTNLIGLSLPSEARFINDWTDGETIWPICPCKSMDLYAAYLKWCKWNGESRPRASNQFLGYVSHLVGWQSARQRLFESYAQVGNPTATTKPMRVIIPPTEILQRSEWEQKPNDTMPQWLTRCAESFADAGKEQKDDERWAA